MNPRVINVKANDDFSLHILFTNNEWRKFDVKPYLDKGIFKQLQNRDMFITCRAVDGTVQWANEADFCPDTLFLESTLVQSSSADAL